MTFTRALGVTLAVAFATGLLAGGRELPRVLSQITSS